MTDEIAETILRLCRKRGPGKTICPSEAARALKSDEADWRAMMGEVRATAADLSRDGKVVITQKGQEVDPDTARGPIRLGLPNDRT